MNFMQRMRRVLLFAVFALGTIPGAAALALARASAADVSAFDPAKTRDPMEKARLAAQAAAAARGGVSAASPSTSAPEAERSGAARAVEISSAAAGSVEASSGPAVAVSTAAPLDLRDAVGDGTLGSSVPSKEKADRHVLPVANAWVLGGQSFRPGADPTRTGSVSLLTALSIPINERWKVLPTYQGYYSATQSTLETGAGTTLVQERMDNRVSAKAIYDTADKRHRVKLTAGYRAELLREAKDEPWGKGLFDYRKPSVGVEWEYFYRQPYSARASYDWFSVTFPNYSSLESQGALLVDGQPVARELVGGKVLDSRNHSVLVGASGPVGRLQALWDVSFTWARQGFTDQPVVASDGRLIPLLRRDISRILEFSVRGVQKVEFPQKVGYGLRLAATAVGSNQNHFEARAGRFFAGYYDFREVRGAPYVTLHFANPVRALKSVRWSLSLDWTARAYPNRQVQDASGAYLGGSVKTLSTSWGSTLTWPITRRMSLMGTLRKNGATSNMRYERLYRYSYSDTSYLAGLGWEF